jgi:hypothetical protein
MVGYGPFFLCVIYKEGQYPGSGGLNRPMMMMMMIIQIALKRLPEGGKRHKKTIVRFPVCNFISMVKDEDDL